MVISLWTRQKNGRAGLRQTEAKMKVTLMANRFARESVMSPVKTI
jgi:hypothetical protein